MKVRAIILILALLAFFTSSIGGYLYYSSMKESAIAESHRDTDTQMRIIADQIDIHLYEHQKMASAITGIKELKRALLATNKSGLAMANAVLDNFKDAIEADVCYLIDHNGNAIASSNRNAPDSFVGKNYAFRYYFREAMQGSPAVYMALEVTSGKRGIYFSHPIYGDKQKTPIGVVVIKDSFVYAEKMIGNNYDGVVSVADPHGVVFVSSREAWLYHMLWKVSPETIAEIEKSKQFGKGPLNWLGLEREGKDSASDKSGNRYMIHSADIGNCQGWKVIYLHDEKIISKKIAEPLLKTVGSMTLAFSILIGLTGFFLYRRASNEITMRKKAEDALRKSEEKYRNIFDSTPDGIYRTDINGVFTMMNGAGAKIFKHERPDEMIGRPALDYWREKKDREDFRSELNIKKAVSGYSIRARTKDGKDIELESTSRIIEDENGNFLGIEGILRDVTERKRMEEELLTARKLESVGILAGGIAHDFNNLMNAILTGIEIIRMHSKSDDKLLKVLGDLEQTSMKASDLTQKLITFSKGGMPLKARISIHELIKGLDYPLVGVAAIRYEFDIPDDLWQVEADERQIRHVLSSMILNSTEAMPRGGVISIRAENINVSAKEGLSIKDGRYIMLSVRDNGTSIPKEIIPRIFDPYFTTKDKWAQKGLGLGLAVCYSIVRNHEGLITVESEVGAGTTFHIYLPADIEEYST